MGTRRSLEENAGLVLAIYLSQDGKSRVKDITQEYSVCLGGESQLFNQFCPHILCRGLSAEP